MYGRTMSRMRMTNLGMVDILAAIVIDIFLLKEPLKAPLFFHNAFLTFGSSILLEKNVRMRLIVLVKLDCPFKMQVVNEVDLMSLPCLGRCCVDNSFYAAPSM